MESVIDTNVLVFDSIENSQFHQEARKILDGMDKWIIPTTVMEELVFVFSRLRLDRSFIIEKIKEILMNEKTELVAVTEDEIASALSLIASEKISFERFNDKLVLSVAEKRKIPLATFDVELGKECRRRDVEVVGKP